MLIYVDRPARVRGEIVYEGRSLRFDIAASEAGYLWVRQPENSGEYTVVPSPKHLVLAWRRTRCRVGKPGKLRAIWSFPGFPTRHPAWYFLRRGPFRF